MTTGIPTMAESSVSAQGDTKHSCIESENQNKLSGVIFVKEYVSTENLHSGIEYVEEQKSSRNNSINPTPTTSGNIRYKGFLSLEIIT